MALPVRLVTASGCMASAAVSNRNSSAQAQANSSIAGFMVVSVMALPS
jgi:hypothetical protein